MSKFDKEYMKYWGEAVQKSVDGTVIADGRVCSKFVELMNLTEGNRVLDLGCSYGRMFPVLREQTSQVYGLELDLDVVNEASKKPYIVVVQGRAESTPFASDFFDGVMAWAVFDGVDQKVAYVEINRILKMGGRLLATGKNARYPADDRLGFVAERNAYAKGFPNRFTDLKKFLQNISLWGFECEKVFLFSKRGDLGLNQVSSFYSDDLIGYEYALVLKKVNVVSGQHEFPEITSSHSFTAISKAQEKGFSDTGEFLKTAFESDWM